MTTEATSTGEEQALDTTAAAATGATEGTASETGAAAAAETASTASTAPQRPEGLDDRFWDEASGLKVGDLVAHNRDLEAAAAARLEGVPAEGESYDLALPADFTVPEGFAVEIKADDPLWAKFQEIGKGAGLPKAEFSKFVGAFAEYQLAVQKADVDAFVAEKTALGANAPARITAAEAWLKTNMPADQAAALADLTVTKAGVEAIETIIRLRSGPVAATNTNPSAPERKFGDGWFKNMPAPKAA